MNYTSLPDEDAEPIIYSQMRSYDEDSRITYARIGLMCVAVTKRLLWRHRIDPEDGMPCRSFARWLRLCAPFSYSTAYAALRDREELADVPEEEFSQITQSNMRTLKSLSTAVRRDPAVLAAAKGKTEALVAHVRKTYPDQHLEASTKMVLNLTEGAKAEIEEAVQLAIERGDSRTKEEAVMMWAIDYKSSCQTPLEEFEDKDCGHA